MDSLVRNADNSHVWRNVRDRFPHPYTRQDGEGWIGLCESGEVESAFAIEVEGEAVGGVGLDRFLDVHRFTCELGYWLGEPYWNRGITTAAARAVTEWGLSSLGIERVHAEVFSWNPASARVLEKAGFLLEGRLRRHVFKHDTLGDVLIYARLREVE